MSAKAIAASATTFIERVERARKQMRQTRPYVKLERQIGKAAGGNLKALCWVADFLGVDARWLATGQRSRASQLAVTFVERALPLGRIDGPASALELLPETPPPPADLFGDMCRYCGCTDDCACDVGCEWVAASICSACLQES
jgi:hypothetical protein